MSKKEKHTKRRWFWQRERTNGLPSTSTNSDKQDIASPVKPQDSSLNDTLHHRCSTLPLSLFIEIILEGDLRWLIINGNPSQSELEAAWTSIVEEYTSIIRTEKSENIFQLYKKIKVAEWQLLFIEKSIAVLKCQYDEEIADWVGEIGFGIVVYSTDREKYLRSLYSIETSAKMLIVLLNQYHAEYQLLNKKDDGEDIQINTRARYEKEIAMLSKFQGYRIIKEKVTVLEYSAIINNYLEDQRLNKKEVNNG